MHGLSVVDWSEAFICGRQCDRSIYSCKACVANSGEKQELNKGQQLQRVAFRSEQQRQNRYVKDYGQQDVRRSVIVNTGLSKPEAHRGFQVEGTWKWGRGSADGRLGALTFLAVEWSRWSTTFSRHTLFALSVVEHGSRILWKQYSTTPVLCCAPQTQRRTALGHCLQYNYNRQFLWTTQSILNYFIYYADINLLLLTKLLFGMPITM